MIALVCVIAGIIVRLIGQPSTSFSSESENQQSNILPLIQTNGVSVRFRAVNPYFYTAQDDGFHLVYLKGVNMGLTEATTDLANPNVSYETYMEWLDLIAQMNANTVRVFTVMPPQFYTALHDYNASSETPLYLIQGIWFNENDMYEGEHAFIDDERIVTSFTRAARETLDIIHGNSDYTDYGEIKNAVYSHDVSQYVVGYILGLEWDPGFVQRTNTQTAYAGYAGEYLKTTDAATPFESFLCEVGDYLITYETETYSAQTPVAFLNWATTDTLTHTNEPFEEEDMVSVNTENIIGTDVYYCGLFAAVDAYPYYPEFMNHQPEYLTALESGEVNPYRTYLAQLRTQYTVPVIIAEFGTSTSRTMAHQSVMGIDQGGLTEEEQGEAIVSMMQSIASENYAGSLIFSWQDEWFKQTWNTFKYAPDDPATRTPNVQSAEQSYGLLAMEPGEQTACFIDGLDNEWTGTKPIVNENGYTVSTMWDEAYLYLKIETSAFDFSRDILLLPVQITGLGSTNAAAYDVSFSDAADFLLVINGETKTQLLTDPYQDLFYYTYSYEKGVFQRDNAMEQQHSGQYTPIRQFISNEIVLPLTGEVIPPQYVESGLLTYGITDPDHEQYCSLADFYCNENMIEVRIPWYLLNVMNSTCGVCLQDFYDAGGVDVMDIDHIKIGVGTPDNDFITLHDIGYTTKAASSFHTRLKQSYFIVQRGMEELIVP